MTQLQSRICMGQVWEEESMLFQLKTLEYDLVSWSAYTCLNYLNYLNGQPTLV